VSSHFFKDGGGGALYTTTTEVEVEVEVENEIEDKEYYRPWYYHGIAAASTR
jgi:hypothetical protein